MNINQLRYFISAATTHSFTKASEEHYISQTAITQQIKALEEQLGVSLFDRKKRPLSLTPAGATFLIEAKAIVERMESAVIKTREASTGIVGNLSIGYTKGFERTDLSKAICDFHHDFPNILITTSRNSADQLASRLISGEYDMVYTWDSTNLCNDPTIASKLCYQAKLVLALYPNHPLARRSSVTRKDLEGENILYLSASTTNATSTYGDIHYLNLYKKAGFEPNFIFYSTDAESVLMMVACEEGISILPDYCTNKLDNADNIVFIPLVGEDEILPIHALWKKDNPNPALKQYVENIK